VFGDDLVATGALLLSELVFRDLSRDAKRYIDDDARDVLVGIGEKTVALGTARLPGPDGPVRVGWWSGYSLVAGVASGPERRAAASFVVFLVLLRLLILWLLSSTALLAGQCVRVFVLLEVVFELFDSLVLDSVLLAKKCVLSEKSEVPLGKDRPTHRTDRRGRMTRRSVRSEKHD
jgi:hypothetical protein